MILKVKNIFCNYKNNIILILLILGAIVNDVTLRALTVGNVFYWKPIVASIAMIILVCLFALLLPQKIRNYFYILFSIYFAILSGINYLYYKYYKSFLSFSLLDQLKQVNEISDSVSKTFDIRVFLFIIPPIVLIYITHRLNNNGFLDEIERNRCKKDFFRPLFLGLVFLISVTTTLTSTDWSRLNKQWNRPYLVEQLGIYPYSIADCIKSFSSNNISDYKADEAIKKLEVFVDKKLEAKTTNKYTNILKGKDIYVIHYESAQTIAMDLEFEDGEVTPFLNKIALEGLFFNNFYTQHSVGTSSDSEFTFNTSLLPINNGTVFMTHFDREYVTLPKLLGNEDYYTFSMHGNNGDFWNRKVMYESIGYDKFFSQKDYELDEIIGLGLSDKSFFKQSIEKIKEVKEEQNKPIMATLITLTNHYPFGDVESYGEFDVGHLEGTDIGNYLKSLHYADGALKSFFEGMEEYGLLDNAVVILYGDHNAKISKKDYNRLYNYDIETDMYYDNNDERYFSVSGSNNKQLKRTPFIIWTKNKEIQPETIEIPMGMVDALPTISNMLGVYNPYQLGHDMINTNENVIVFPNGNWLDNNSYYSASSSKVYKFNDSDDNTVSNVNDINLMVEDTIELSNSIIQYDLIKSFNSLLVQNKIFIGETSTITNKD